jgi:2-haloacid dehalogenase
MQAVSIDDSLANVKAAQQLGFNSIHFKTPQELKRELLALGILK